MKSTRTELSQERPRSDCQKNLFEGNRKASLQKPKQGGGSRPLLKCLQGGEASWAALTLGPLPVKLKRANKHRVILGSLNIWTLKVPPLCASPSLPEDRLAQQMAIFWGVRFACTWGWGGVRVTKGGGLLFCFSK